MTTPFTTAINFWRERGLGRGEAVHRVVGGNLQAQPTSRWDRRGLWRFPGQREDLRDIGSRITLAFREGDERDFIEALDELRQLGRDWGRPMSSWENRHGGFAYWSCDHCNALSHGEVDRTNAESGAPICDSCAECYYVYSDCMGGYIESDSAWPVYFSLRHWRRNEPDDHCTRHYGRNNLYQPDSGDHCFFDEDTYYSWEEENRESCDDDDSDGRDESDGLIDGYHSGRDVGHIPSSYDKRKPGVWMGLELEIECGERSRTEVASSINSNVNTDRKYVRFEDDGSLSYGFEVISGYTGLDTHEKWLKRFAEANLKGCKSHDTSTCGLHVHITKADLTPYEAARLMLFMHNPANEQLIRAVARRYGKTAGYAKFIDKTRPTDDSSAAIHAAYVAKTRSNGNLYQMNYDRYEALNFQPEHTVEYRMYRGTLKVATIMACLEFTWLTYWFAKQTSITRLGTEDFIKWISLPENRRESRYLRQLLKAKGLMPESKAEVSIEAESPDDSVGAPPTPRIRRCEQTA